MRRKGSASKDRGESRRRGGERGFEVAWGSFRVVVFTSAVTLKCEFLKFDRAPVRISDVKFRNGVRSLLAGETPAPVINRMLYI
jgi:hypothetical protein